MPWQGVIKEVFRDIGQIEDVIACCPCSSDEVFSEAVASQRSDIHGGFLTEKQKEDFDETVRRHEKNEGREFPFNLTKHDVIIYVRC